MSANKLNSMSKAASSSKKSSIWKSHGLIIKPQESLEWMNSHISVPCGESLGGDLHRIYFCSRDKLNRSQIGYADIDLNEPEKILRISEKPILGLGELGCFDDNGVTPTWVLNIGDKKLLYYVGWNKGTTVRMHLFTGLAISHDGGQTFQRHSRAPLLERIPADHLLTATLSVLEEDGIFRMWYVSGDKWYLQNGESFPCYNIKYAESKDGIAWNRKGHVCIDYANSREHALARPCVIKENGIYKMWFSYKGDDYRIGYAESKNGLDWERMDSLSGMAPPPEGFDSTMQEYAYVVAHKGKKHMFYNGNEYGKEGIGYAVSE